MSAALAAAETIEEVLVHTGQHYDHAMSDVFFAELGLSEPTYNLGIGGGTHGENTGRMIEGLERLMIVEKPDWVMVYGDTDSTLAGAIAASKLHIPIAHVEAGLRSYNMRMPEEVNRRLTDHCSSMLFTPTTQAEANLASEGIDSALIETVGDVMYDACLMYGGDGEGATLLDLHGLQPGSYVLSTVHRQENTDSPHRLAAILAALASVPKPVVLPLHPRARQRIASFGLTLPKNVIAIEPLGYRSMSALLKHADYVATDSGGVQKEAYFHRVPCITLRDETEWVELVDLGWNSVVSPDAPELARIVATPPARGREDCAPYGDGKAAARIAAAFALR